MDNSEEFYKVIDNSRSVFRTIGKTKKYICCLRPKELSTIRQTSSNTTPSISLDPSLNILCENNEIFFTQLVLSWTNGLHLYELTLTYDDLIDINDSRLPWDKFVPRLFHAVELGTLSPHFKGENASTKEILSLSLSLSLSVEAETDPANKDTHFEFDLPIIRVNKEKHIQSILLDLALHAKDLNHQVGGLSQELQMANSKAREAETRAFEAEGRIKMLQGGFEPENQEHLMDNRADENNHSRCLKRKMSSMNLLQPGHRRRVARGAKLTHRY